MTRTNGEIALKTLFAILAGLLATGAAEAHPAASLHLHAASQPVQMHAALVLLGVLAVWAAGVWVVETIAARRGV